MRSEKSSKAFTDPSSPLAGAGWGLTTLFIQAPLVQMILADSQSLELGVWNHRTFGLLILLTFLLLPLVTEVVWRGLVRFHRSGAIGLCVVGSVTLLMMQLNYHVLQGQFMEAGWRRPVLWMGWIALILLGWKGRAFLVRLLKNTVWLSPVLLGVFVAGAAPGNNAFVPAPSAPIPQVVSSTSGPVFILSFEKLVHAYLTDSDGRFLASRFPNLARFVSEADYYPHAYANSTATVYALKTIYSGRLQSADRNWTRHPNIRDLWRGRGQVILLLDLLTDYGRPGLDVSVKTIGTEHLAGWKLILGWYKTLGTIWLPDPIEGRLALLGWRFDPRLDLWDAEAKNLPPGRTMTEQVGLRQMERLKTVLREKGRAPNLYLMHSFISDGPGAKTSAFLPRTAETYQADLESARRNLALFDEQLGALLDFLKTEGIYDSASILIVSDTGYDPQARHLHSAPELPASAEMIRIFCALKRPHQDGGRRFSGVLRQIDILPTLLAGLGMDPTPYDFEGTPLTDPDEPSDLQERPLEIVISSEAAGLLYYRLTESTGPLKRIHR